MKQVLLIDDSDVFRDYIHDKLKSKNIEVTIGVGPLDSLSKMRNLLPDLVVMDFNSNRAEFFDLLEKKLGDANARDIPVILLANNVSKEELSRLASFNIKKIVPKPLKIDQFFEAVTPMLVLPAHLLKDVRGAALRTSSLARTPVGSGRFRFVSWKAGSSVEVAADTGNYRGRPHVDRVIWNFAPDPNTALTRLVGGEADVLELTPPQLPQLATNKNIRTVFVPGLDYNFIQFNLRDPSNAARPHPLFGDRNLRRALTMAVDRQRIVESIDAHMTFTMHLRGEPGSGNGLRRRHYWRRRARAGDGVLPDANGRP